MGTLRYGGLAGDTRDNLYSEVGGRTAGYAVHLSCGASTSAGIDSRAGQSGYLDKGKRGAGSFFERQDRRNVIAHCLELRVRRRTIECMIAESETELLHHWCWLDIVACRRASQDSAFFVTG